MFILRMGPQKAHLGQGDFELQVVDFQYYEYPPADGFYGLAPAMIAGVPIEGSSPADF